MERRDTHGNTVTSTGVLIALGDHFRRMVQGDVAEAWGSHAIGDDRWGSFKKLNAIIFAKHFALSSYGGKPLGDQLLQTAMLRVNEMAIFFYKDRKGALSETDYVTDLLDICILADIGVILNPETHPQTEA